MSTPSGSKPPGYDLACPKHHPRTYRECRCPFPPVPRKPTQKDTCRWCCTLPYDACGNREHWRLIKEEYEAADLQWRRTYDEPATGGETRAAGPEPPLDPNSPEAIALHLAETARKIEEARQHPERGLTDEEQALFRERFGPRLLPRPSQVPPALINLKRWVCWKKVSDEEKSRRTGKPEFRKPPFSPTTGGAIGATQKYVDHFVDFETAREAVKRFKLDGLGFVFLEGDDFVGIDFDDCVTTQRIKGHDAYVTHPEIENWLKWFATTYQEYSPSGTGIHIICRGKIAKALIATALPNGGGATWEAYNQGRYFTFTGRRIGITLEVSDCQVSIDKLAGSTIPASETGPKKPHAMSVGQAHQLYQDKLEGLRDAKEGEGNALLNKAAFFAGQAFAAGALKQTEEQAKTELLNIVTVEWKNPHDEHGARQTIQSGWGTGVREPLAIITACTDLGNAEYRPTATRWAGTCGTGTAGKPTASGGSKGWRMRRCGPSTTRRPRRKTTTTASGSPPGR